MVCRRLYVLRVRVETDQFLLIFTFLKVIFYGSSLFRRQLSSRFLLMRREPPTQCLNIHRRRRLRLAGEINRLFVTPPWELIRTSVSSILNQQPGAGLFLRLARTPRTSCVSPYRSVDQFTEYNLDAVVHVIYFIQPG
jgi:hypothetical protein